MKNANNIVKEYLKNVYFISGTPCGGKTAIAHTLGEKYNIPVYDVNEVFEKHQEMSDFEHQPAMNHYFANADEFFGRSAEEYRNWLLEHTKEQLDFVILDLIRIAQKEKVICDCHITIEEAKEITEPSRLVFFIGEPSNLVDEYWNRPDHQGLSDFIHSATDYENAKRTCNETLRSLNGEHYNAIKRSEYFWLECDSNRSVFETASLVEQYWGWNLIENIKIEKVEKNSELAAELLKFVEECSWDEAKNHIAEMIRDWVFTDWEAFFIAILNGKIVGITSIMKTDYYPMPEIFPWISCVYVSDRYRGNRISEQLISYANRYAKEHGFEKSYIPSEFFGLYEKYGYHYVKDIVNYGNGIDHLFLKELK